MEAQSKEAPLTPDQDRVMKAFDCQLSYAEIGAIIGMNRAQIAGHVRRLRHRGILPPAGRVDRDSLIEKRRRAAARKPRKNPNMRRFRPRKQYRKVTVKQPPKEAPISLNLSLEELTPCTCKYPYGDGPFTFCGHPVEEGKSWCAFHMGVVFNAV